MRATPRRLLRASLQRAKALVKATRMGRNLLSDLNNSDEFTSLLAHERMLADAIRVDTYHEAIRRHVRPGSVVVDLGTGTGILALFAARQQPRIVYAIDHSEFINVARRIAAHNGVENIEFVPSNSREFTPAEPVDLIIHEQIGDELFTENMLENLLDLKRRALKPGGRILPARFELFVEPVQLRAGQRLPYLWEQPVHGIDFSLLRDDAEAARYRPADYDGYMLEPGAVDHMLCEQEPMLRLDLDAMTDPAQMRHTASATRVVVRGGHLDGFALYFRVMFDDDLGFDTSPLSPLTHWRSRLYRTPRRLCPAGTTLRWEVNITDVVDANRWTVTVDAGAVESVVH